MSHDDGMLETRPQGRKKYRTFIRTSYEGSMLSSLLLEKVNTVKHCLVPRPLLGSLRNHDGDAEDNVD